MTVNEWIKGGCDYTKGLELYASLPNYNKHFFKAMQRKNSPQNLMKLRYELQKQLKPTFNVTIPAEIEKPPIIPKYYREVKINQLPVELHGVYIQQKNDFGLACSLKIQLNAMGHYYDANGNIVLAADGLPKLKPQTKDDQEKALKICLRIESLFDAIDKTWGIIDYYLEHKVVPKIETNDFTQLSEGKLRDKLISVRSSITRQETRLAMLQQKLDNAVAKKFKIQYERNIRKCENKLMQLNQDKIKLLEIRDHEK